jgi:CPA1 family monovalent cation:H+ antiporter
MTDQPTSLTQVERFAELTDAEVARLAGAGTYVTVPEDWALPAEAASSDRTYLLISGEASVRRQGEEVRTLGPGQVFGGMGVGGAALRSATVVARTRLECLHFTGQQAAELRGELPAFAAALDEAAGETIGQTVGETTGQMAGETAGETAGDRAVPEE